MQDGDQSHGIKSVSLCCQFQWKLLC